MRYHLLLVLFRAGLLPDGLELVEQINLTRTLPMVPYEKTALTKKVRSTWLWRAFRTMNDDLAGCSLAEVLEKLEKGKIGHRAAMDWLNISSLNDLVEIMHVNGRLMPGHQTMRIPPRTVDLVRAITRPAGGTRPD